VLPTQCLIPGDRNLIEQFLNNQIYISSASYSAAPGDRIPVTMVATMAEVFICVFCFCRTFLQALS
jgi:hypothetical protein